MDVSSRRKSGAAVLFSQEHSEFSTRGVGVHDIALVNDPVYVLEVVVRIG